MLPLLALMAIGAATGAGKAEFIDKPKEERDRKLAATKNFVSPWTHMQADPVQEHNTFGSAFQGASTAGALGQWYKNQEVPEQPGIQPDMSQTGWAPEGSTDINNPPRTTIYDKTPSGYPLTQPAQGAAGNYTDWLAMSADQSPRAGQGRPNYVMR